MPGVYFITVVYFPVFLLPGLYSSPLQIACIVPLQRPSASSPLSITFIYRQLPLLHVCAVRLLWQILPGWGADRRAKSICQMARRYTIPGFCGGLTEISLEQPKRFF